MTTAVRREILGVPADAIDMPGALAFVHRMVQEAAAPACILAVNPEKVIALGKDPWLFGFFRKADLLLPDGIGVVWALRVLHRVRARRVPGADLMQAVCGQAAQNGWGVFLFGAQEQVNAGAAAELARRFPGLRVAGRANGYLSALEAASLPGQINASGAQILFVALGSPRQERWMAENAGILNVKVIQGIGGTLDTITGKVKRAPRLFRRLHLEWFYRLLSDPRRLRRQAVLPFFVWRVLREKWGGRLGR